MLAAASVVLSVGIALAAVRLDASGGEAGPPAAPQAPAAVLVAATGQTADSGFPCLKGSRTHQNMSRSERNGHRSWIFSASSDTCSIDMHAEGEIAFKGDLSDLQSISPGGFLHVSQREGGRVRRMEVNAGSDGRLAYRYTENGQTAEITPQVRAWFAAFLLALERQTGFAVGARVPALLDQGGPGAVLDEIGRLESDYVRALYTLKLLDLRKLDASMLRRAIEGTGSGMRSDYERARVLMKIASLYPLDEEEASRQAFAGATRTMRSDYERARVLLALLERPGLSREVIHTALESASEFKSDYERARVLLGIAASPRLDEPLQLAYVDAASKGRSDYERARVLTGLLKTDKLAGAVVARVIRATLDMRSDYERARVLLAVAAKHRLEGDLRSEYLKAADALKSQYERQRALNAIGMAADRVKHI